MDCAINKNTSWFIGCHGKEEPLAGNAGNLRLFVPVGKNKYRLKVRTLLG